jgi:DNA end-binding protein Ku
MAPRANWKGFLRLSLVTCPVALYPATSESEKISFNQLNRATGHRIKHLKVDADTGEEVANEDIVKGYKVDTDTFIEVTKEELENVALESTRTIEITSSSTAARSIRGTSSAPTICVRTARSATTPSR